MDMTEILKMLNNNENQNNSDLTSVLSAMNGNGDLSSILPMLMSMNNKKQNNASSNESVQNIPSDEEVNMTLKKLNS